MQTHKISFFVAILAALTIFHSTFAIALEDSSSSYTVAGANQIGWDNVRDPMGGIPFLQGALGAADYDTVDGIFNGHQLNIRAGLSHYLPDRTWVFDGAFGIHHARIDSADSSLLAFVAEGAARYRFLAYWSTGPILNTYIGNGATFQLNSGLLTSFLGVEFARDIPLESNILRLSFRMMTDINVPDVRANMMMLNFAWSFPIGRTAPAVIASLEEQRGIRRARRDDDGPVLIEEPVEFGAISEPLVLEMEEEHASRPEEIYKVTPPSQEDRVEDLAVASISKASSSYDSVPLVTGDPDKLSTRAAAKGEGEIAETHELEKPKGPGGVLRVKVADFGVGRVVPKKGQEQKIGRLGQALVQNRHLFERIEVIGHADPNGKKKNLDKVAQYRARGVMEMLAKSGVPRSILKNHGLGNVSTIGSGKWGRLNGQSRRAELHFHGVHSPKELNRLVERALQ